MRSRRTPAPAVELHIERLVVDGLHLPVRQRDHLVSGLSDELEQALTRLFSVATLDARPGRVDELTLAVDHQPGRDGQTVGRGLGRALADGIGPRLVPTRTGDGR